jgi:hypothetical protein
LIVSNGFKKYVDFIQYIFTSLECKLENGDDVFE